MKINLNGKLNPYIAFSIYLSYILLIAILSLSQDKDAIEQQFHLIESGLFSKTTLLVTQGVTSIIMFIVIPFVFLKILGVNFTETFLKNANYKIEHYLLVGLLVIGFMPMNTYIGEWNAQLPFSSEIVEMEEIAGRLTKLITNFSSSTELIIGFFVIAIVAGIGEELTFRAILQNQISFLTKNKHIAIWVSAILFSAIHMQFLGFFPRMLLGALFGYIYIWSGNITLAMFGHFVNNGFAVIMMHLYNNKVITTDLDKVENIPISVAFPSLIFSIGMLFFLHKTVKND